MGSCATKVQTNSHEKQHKQKTKENQQNLQQGQDPQGLELTVTLSYIKKKGPSMTNITAETNQEALFDQNDLAADSFITLDDLLASDHDGGGMEEWNSHNTKSGIFKLSKKKTVEQEGGTKSNIVPKSYVTRATLERNFQMTQYEQTVSAVMQQKKDSVTFKIHMNQLDFQFSLPKCRAGPLVVPLINYNVYSV